MTHFGVKLSIWFELLHFCVFELGSFVDLIKLFQFLFGQMFFSDHLISFKLIITKFCLEVEVFGLA